MKKTASLVLILTLGMLTGLAKADFTFGTPVNLGHTINNTTLFVDSFSADGLEMYLDGPDRPGGIGTWDIWVSKRPTTADDWGAPENLGTPVNTGGWDFYPSISADGLELYFVRQQTGDIWLTTRATTDDDWANPEKLGPEFNTSGKEDSPCISPDGRELYFVSRNRVGGYGSDDIWVARRATKHDPWESPVNLGAGVNSSASEAMPGLSADGLLLFFSGNTGQPQRSGGYGSIDMWVTRRASLSGPWGTPTNLGPIVNTAGMDGTPRLSPDGSTLYFNSERPGGFGGFFGDIYQAPLIPIVDFTGDYIVDIEDLILLIEHWGQNEPSFDMGPTPLGDGIVDAQDLEILMGFWGQALEDPYFIAHWKLDEIEGRFAYDSAAENDGIVLGDPMWQPEGGHMNGALEFDGIDDVIIVKSVVNPEDGPFSVFAWIKGGAPDQAILSQQGSANWLQVDVNGTLMTELTKSGGRNPGVPLYSETVITDENWHRVGFVWDGIDRILYVDDVEVARDTLAGLSGTDVGLRIGAGEDLAVASFWAGMIDDVRIYDRAVEP
jgi:hypothetical protein